MHVFCIREGTQAVASDGAVFRITEDRTYDDGDLVIDPVRYANGHLTGSLFADVRAANGFSVFSDEGRVFAVETSAVEVF